MIILLIFILLFILFFWNLVSYEILFKICFEYLNMWNEKGHLGIGISLNTSGHGDGRTEGPFARIGTLGLSQLCSQLLPSHLYVTSMGNMSLNEWVGSNSWELGLSQSGTWSWGGAHIGHLSALSLSTACNVWVLGEQDVGRKKNGKNCQSNNKQLHLRTAQGKRTEESRETSISLLLCGSATLFGKGACAGNRSQSHALAWPSPSTAALHLMLATWAKVPKSSRHKMPS